MSFNNIEPVKLYPESKNKKFSLLGPFQGIPLETDNTMPPKKGFTPLPAVSRRERNPSEPYTGGGPRPPSVFPAPPPNRFALFGPGVPTIATLAPGNATGTQTTAQGSHNGGNAGGNTTPTQGGTPGTNATTPTNTGGNTTSGNTTTNSSSNRTTGSGAAPRSTAGGNTTNARPTSNNTTGSSNAAGGNARTRQAAPVRGNVGGFSDIMDELNGRPPRSQAANNAASNNATSSITASNNATSSNAASNNAASNMTRSNTTGNSASRGGGTASTAHGSRPPQSTTAGPVASANTTSASITPRTTASATTSTANATATGIVPATTIPATTAAVGAVASTTPASSNAAGKRPATGVSGSIGTQSDAERVAEADRLAELTRGTADDLDWGDDNDEEAEEADGVPRFAAMPPPGSMPAFGSMPILSFMPPFAPTAPLVPTLPFGSTPPVGSAAPDGSSMDQDTTGSIYNARESEYDLARAAQANDYGAVDMALEATSEQMAERTILRPTSRRQAGAAAEAPSSTADSSIPRYHFGTGQALPGLFLITTAAENGGSTGSTEYQGPVMADWGQAGELGSTLPDAAGEPEPWEAGLYERVPHEDTAMGRDGQPSNQEEGMSEEEIVRRIEIELAENDETGQLPSLQTAHQPATQTATDADNHLAMDDVQLQPGDMELPREVVPMDEDEHKDQDKAEEEGEKMDEDEKAAEGEKMEEDKKEGDVEKDGQGEKEGEPEKGKEKAVKEEDDLYGVTPSSSSLSSAPDSPVDPREHGSTQVHDSRMPPGEAPGHPTPQWASTFAQAAGHIASVADPTVSAADPADGMSVRRESIQPWEGDTPMPDISDPQEHMRPSIERNPISAPLDLTSIAPMSGALWTTFRTAAGAPDGDDSSSSEDEDDGKRPDERPDDRLDGNGDGRGGEDDRGGEPAWMRPRPEIGADLTDGVAASEIPEDVEQHLNDISHGDTPSSPPPPPATEADPAHDAAAPPDPEPAEGHHSDLSGGDQPAAPPPQPAPVADRTEDATASPMPADVERHDQDLRDGDMPAAPQARPSPVADLVDDVAASAMPAKVERHDNDLRFGETPVQRLFMQIKELSVKNLLVQAVTLLAHFSALPRTSIVQAADYAREASRLAAELRVSEALKARCAYYVAFAEVVLCPKFVTGLPVSSYNYDDYIASDDTYLYCFQRAEAAKGVYREGAWATTWLGYISPMTGSCTVGKPERASKRHKFMSLREFNERYHHNVTDEEPPSREPLSTETPSPEPLSPEPSPDIRGTFTRTAAGERMRTADARGRLPLHNTERPRVEPIDTSHVIPSLGRKGHAKTRSISQLARVITIPGSFPEMEVSPESKMEEGESPWKSTFEEKKPSRWCVVM